MVNSSSKHFPLWKKVLFSIVVCVVLSSVLWVGSVIIRSGLLYHYVKTSSSGWLSPAHHPDRELGFAPIPGVASAEVFPMGKRVPMRYDHLGFRAPVGRDVDELRRPLILTLGCSFTYGAACPAEETYPFLLADLVGGSVINAGVPSYGLAQMLILAKKLVPEYRPDYVVVQYSPWLVDRAVSPFSPTYFSYAPNPYFVDAKDGGVELAPPVFLGKHVDLSPYRASGVGVGEFITFTLRTAFPLFAHDDYQITVYRLVNVFGMGRTPAANKEKVADFVYSQITSVCEDAGSVMVEAVLGGNHNKVEPPEAIRSMNLVDTHAAMLSALDGIDRQSYATAYFHYYGNPPVLIDSHPNHRAHNIIADKIYQFLLDMQSGRDN